MTVSEIAKELDERVYRVRYIVDYYRIEPAARAGMVRLFTPAQRDIIKSRLFNLQIQNRH
jgi:hypothetical protein